MTKLLHDSETPASGQQIFSACAFLHKKIKGVNHIFLPKRALTKKFLPEVYELPGGHIDYGEDMVDGLRREVMEELAVRIKVGDPFYVYTYQNRIKGSHTIEVVYFATFDEPEENIKIMPADHSEYGWFSKEQVESVVVANRAKVTHLNSIQIDTDHEIQAMLKGFAYLEHKPPDFA